MAICSTERKDDSCAQAEKFKSKAGLLGMRVEVLRLDMSHGQTNSELGADERYTQAVERFMSELDPAVKQMLTE